MILTFNIENSKTFIGCADEKENKILFEEALSTSASRTTVEYCIIIRQLLDMKKIETSAIEGAIIASCVPQVTSIIRNAVNETFGVDTIVVGPGVKSGVDIRIEEPTQLGGDLLVAAAAGIAEYGNSTMIIILGTAGAISVIDRNGSYIGGLIIPGVKVSLESLSDSAVELPGAAINVPSKLIGKSTVKAMQSGVIYGCAASIDGLLERIQSELGYRMSNIIVTGEFAELIAPLCRTRMTLDPHLIMKGLIYVYNRNKKKRGTP